MKKTSFQIQPSYEAKSGLGTLADVALLAFGFLFAVFGILFLLRGLSFSTYLSSVEVIAGGIFLGGGTVLPLLLRSNSRKTKENCVEFVNSVSDLVKSWAVLHLGSYACEACCELLDGYYLELTVRARSLNAISFTIYKFLTPTQNVWNKPLLDMEAPKKRILPLIMVPLDVDGFQKWKAQKEKWKSMIAEDDELREQISMHSLRYSMIERHTLQGILSIDAAGYEKYLMHPQLKGQYLYGKSLGVRMIFYKSKASIKKTSIGFKTPQTVNTQLIHIGRRVLEHIIEGRKEGNRNSMQT